MPQLITFFIIITIIYWIARRATRKETRQYVEENPEPKEAQNIETVDSMTEIIVEFVFLRIKNQFMIHSFPNIVINNVETYKMMNDKLTLKLPTKFHLHFGMPYLSGESYKLSESYNLKLGRKYRVTIKPKAFVFLKPKVSVDEIGLI